jgi:hypothetical protein
VIPSEHFNTVLYTGNGSTQSITGVGFQPDFIWFKNRTGTNSHSVVDSVRGHSSPVFPNLTLVEQTSAQGKDVTSFNTDGFSIGAVEMSGSVNISGGSIVAWNWKAGGTAVSNTNGSITSSVSANADAGFSVVSYTGTGSAGTVGHGLSQPLDIIIVKNRSVTNYWPVWNRTVSSGNGKYLYLNATNGTSGPAGIPLWDTTDTTTQASSSTFDIGANSLVSGSGNAQIAYCLHSVDGYSKVGSYSGNGSADGTFVHTGFRPAYVMLKSTAGATTNWNIYDAKRDTYNEVTKEIYADLTNAEYDSTRPMDFTSNGFKFRTSSLINTNNVSYIYLAFAESPFKHSNAR